jgi:hypothetical protein
LLELWVRAGAARLLDNPPARVRFDAPGFGARERGS